MTGRHHMITDGSAALWPHMTFCESVKLLEAWDGSICQVVKPLY
jgi:hypothetical protein